MSPEAFAKLLRLLDPDPEQAPCVYEAIRRKLVKFFEWQGVSQKRRVWPEDCCDATLDRVAERLEEGLEIKSPVGFILGVARNVANEVFREPPLDPLPADPHYDHGPGEQPAGGNLNPYSDEEKERQLLMEQWREECMNECLNELPAEKREVFIAFHGYGFGASRKPKERRRALAEQLGISRGGLRTRVHRIRVVLEPCVRDCLEKKEP